MSCARCLTTAGRILLGARYYPVIAVPHRSGLQATDITPSEWFADGQANKLLASQDFWDNLGFDLFRAKVEDWWEANNASREEAVDIPTAATTSEFKI